MVKCADAVPMQCRCSVHTVHTQCSRYGETWPMGTARRRLPRLLTARLAAVGGLTIVPLGASHCLSGSRVLARASRVAHSTGLGHPGTRTRTGSCTSATVARIHSAHVDSSGEGAPSMLSCRSRISLTFSPLDDRLLLSLSWLLGSCVTPIRRFPSSAV